MRSPPVPTLFSITLRGVREARRMSLRAAANGAGVSAATWHRIEAGKLPDVLLDNIRPTRWPIPFKGAQGFFNVPDRAAARRAPATR